MGKFNVKTISDLCNFNFELLSIYVNTIHNVLIK